MKLMMTLKTISAENKLHIKRQRHQQENTMTKNIRKQQMQNKKENEKKKQHTHAVSY